MFSISPHFFLSPIRHFSNSPTSPFPPLIIQLNKDIWKQPLPSSPILLWSRCNCPVLRPNCFFLLFDLNLYTNAHKLLPQCNTMYCGSLRCLFGFHFDIFCILCIFHFLLLFCSFNKKIQSQSCLKWSTHPWFQIFGCTFTVFFPFMRTFICGENMLLWWAILMLCQQM